MKALAKSCAYQPRRPSGLLEQSDGHEVLDRAFGLVLSLPLALGHRKRYCAHSVLRSWYAMNKFGFPRDKRFRYRIDDRWYRINPDGAEVLTLLQEIYDAGVLPRDSYWALRMRPQIRRIECLNVRSVLVLVIEKTSDARMRLLAIWLRGRCGGYLGKSTIASFANTTGFETQKECVRALHRLSGWADLNEIACNAKHPRIRNLATHRAVKPLEERLSCMLANVQPIPITKPKLRLWLLAGLALEYTAPKSIDTIRQILTRIKRLVSH